MQPDTRYAKSGEVNIAYQMFGEGPINLVFAPPFVSNIENYWNAPDFASWLLRMGSYARVVMFDKRGTGLSDPAPSTQTLEERMDDVLAVMDAAGSERAVLLGTSEGGPMAALFAATHPERCESLVLYGACDAVVRTPYGPFVEALERLVQMTDVAQLRAALGADLTSQLEVFLQEFDATNFATPSDTHLTFTVSSSAPASLGALFPGPNPGPDPTIGARDPRISTAPRPSSRRSRPSA